MPDTHGVTNQLFSSTSNAEGSGWTFEGGEDRHGREKGRKRSIGGPEGPPVAQFGAKTWQQRDLPGVKARRGATEATQRGVGVL